MPSTLLVVVAVLVPLLVAVGLAATHPPRWDLTAATLGAKVGLVPLLAVTFLPAVGPRFDAWYLRWLVVVFGVCYALCTIFLPLAALVGGYVTATGVRSAREAVVFGTPAVAGAAWWVGLLCWRWFRLDAAPIPGAVGSFDALDLVTLPTFVAALAYAAARARREGTIEARTRG